MKKKKQSLTTNSVLRKAPVLLIGWGREGRKDVTAARKEFPSDEGMDCVDACGCDSAEVLELVGTWLSDNPNAQFLYIGSHGNKEGLTTIGKPRLGTPKIRWKKLAAALSKAKKPITLWLGACSSTFVAEEWNKGPTPPVSLIVGFSGTTRTDTVMKALQELLRRSNTGHRDTDQEIDITFLTDDVIELPQNFKGITMHYRVKEHGFVDCAHFRKITGVEFQDRLDSNCNKAEVTRFFGNLARRLVSDKKEDADRKGTRGPSKILEVRKLKAKKRKN